MRVETISNHRLITGLETRRGNKIGTEIIVKREEEAERKGKVKIGLALKETLTTSRNKDHICMVYHYVQC